MTERERMIKLIETGTRIAYDRSLEEVKRIVKENHHFNSATDRTVSVSEMVADFLLENGVIVPPVKVGDTFFYLYFSDDEKKYQIDELKVLDVSTKKVFINEFGDTIGIDEFGTTAFINYTAAKEAVERLNNEK